MKVSSLSAEVVEQGFAVHHAIQPSSSTIKGKAIALLKQLDRMGSAIALGEAGDLDGAHELRCKFAEV